MDLCRCQDHACPDKEGCLRYTLRESGTVHAVSLRSGGVCRALIPLYEAEARYLKSADELLDIIRSRPTGHA